MSGDHVIQVTLEQLRQVFSELGLGESRADQVFEQFDPHEAKEAKEGEPREGEDHPTKAGSKKSI